MLRIPFREHNFEWLRADNRRRPKWNKQFKCWEIPNAWFEPVTRGLLARFTRAFVIQPYRELETCAPACWNALGVICECSCMGANHGSHNDDRWHVVDETFAFRWNDRELACRLISASR